MNNVDFILCKFKLATHKNIVFIAIQGAINKYTTLQVQKYCQSFQKENTIIILSLAQVNYVDSTGLGVLVNFQQQCEEKKIDLSLCMVPAKIHHLFSMLGMTSCFSIFESVKSTFEDIDKKHGLDYPVLEYLAKIKSVELQEDKKSPSSKAQEVDETTNSESKNTSEKLQDTFLLDIKYNSSLAVKKKSVIQVSLQTQKNDASIQIIPNIDGCIIQPPIFYLTKNNCQIHFSVIPIVPEKKVFFNLDVFAKNHHRLSYPIEIKRWGKTTTVLRRIVKLTN